MKIFRFDPGVGRSLERYDSTGFTISGIARLFDKAAVHCAYLSPGGVIGRHRAILDQLFLVVNGKGWVRGDSLEQIPIHAGQAAFWENGELHESGTETGMTAVIIEGGKFDPAELMPPV